MPAVTNLKAKRALNKRPAKAKAPVAKRESPSRKPGRPAGAVSSVFDRDTVIAVAFALTKTTPVTDVSIVRVARELGVTPALVHYYLDGGGRDALTTGVMNSFYREVIHQWPPTTGDWRHNFEVVAESIYRAYVRYPGISAYATSHNKYQLVQDVRNGEPDYGLLVLEKFTGTVREIGLNAHRTGVLAHLFMLFIQAFAHATVARRWPGQHGEFLNNKLSMLDLLTFPNCHFVRESLTHLNANEAFAVGLKFILDGLEAERARAAISEGPP
jgi:hypothetical protein